MIPYIQYHTMLCALYSDIASAFPAQNKSTHDKDLCLLKRRFKSEGIAFLTKTLPRYAKAIDFALATGSVLDIQGFEKIPGTCYPRFLGWLVEQIFDEHGVELDNSSSIALRYLRQILSLFYKLEMPYSPDDVARVLREFVETDAALGKGWHISDPLQYEELKYASKLIKRVLSGVCPRNIIPKHGPGSVATGEKSQDKPFFRRDYTEATSVYPLDSHYYFNSAHLAECLDGQELKTRDPKGKLHSWITLGSSTAKVVLVPKDSRGPRLISMEPLEIQWLQQGQCELLVSSIESHWMTKGHVNFQSQDINRYLAWHSSYHPLGIPESWDPAVNTLAKALFPTSGTFEYHADLPVAHDPSDESQVLVTVDMKEASDRVSVGHVANLFPSNWVEALYATRSSRTELPDGVTVELEKFAPMGSAICFPVESMVFWAMAVASIRYRNPRFASQNDGKPLLQQLKKRVWVYGDDLILYREDYAIVKQSLERTGLLLNANKCCTARFFRESCGMDAYKGTNVTPLRIKECVGSHWSGQMLMSYVAYSNAAWAMGYHKLAEVLERTVQDVTKVPYTTVDRGGIQFVRPEANVRDLNRRRGIRVRFNNELHFLEAYGPAPRAVITSNHNVTWETYLDKYVSSHRGSNMELTPPTTTKGGLNGPLTVGRLKADQYPVPRRVTSNRGWKQITVG